MLRSEDIEGEDMRRLYAGDYKVSQIYKGPTHKGVDLVGLPDKRIFSSVKGVVSAVRVDTHPSGGFGLYVRIKADDTGYYHYFCHLAQALVVEGQLVSEGTLIGIEGSTGNSTGPHCHYEIRRELSNQTFIDPTVFLGIPNVLMTHHAEVDYRKLYEECQEMLMRSIAENDIATNKLSRIRSILDE